MAGATGRTERTVRAIAGFGLGEALAAAERVAAAQIPHRARRDPKALHLERRHVGPRPLDADAQPREMPLRIEMPFRVEDEPAFVLRRHGAGQGCDHRRQY